MRIQRFAIFLTLSLCGSALAFLAIQPVVAEDNPPLTKGAVDPQWLALVEVASVVTPSLNVNLTNGLVAGRVPLGSPVTLRLTRGTALIAYQTLTPIPDGQGFFYVGGFEYPHFTVGDLLLVTQASTVMTLTIPSLSALADVNSAVISGTAPASATLTIDLFPFDAPENAQTHIVTATVDGRYQASLPLRPRDMGYVRYAPQPERQVYVRWVAPFLRVQAGGWPISGYAAPWNEVFITVYDEGGAQLTGRYSFAIGDGSFAMDNYCYYEKVPCPTTLHPGYRVVAEAAGRTFSTTVASLSAVAEAGQVTGTAPPNASVEILSFNGQVAADSDDIWYRAPDAQVTVTATTSGQYTVTLPFPLAYGAAIVTDPEGHQTFARFATPVMSVRLVNVDVAFWNAAMLWGQVNETQTSITISIQGTSGYLKDLRLLTTGNSGFFLDGWIPWMYSPPDFPKLEAGDALTVTTPRGPALALTVPLLTAEANALSSTVTGSAPPNAPLLVALSDSWGGHYYSQAVTATAQGTYAVDFSGLGGFTGWAIGEVSWVTADGHTVIRNFKATSNCAPRFYSVPVGGNTLAFDLADSCPGLTLRLRDAGGQVKYETVVAAYWKGFYEILVDANGRPIPILPGDQIELTSANAPTYTLTIPTLTVQLDVAANTVTGQAPPGDVVDLWLDSLAHSITTTVSAQGIYTISLAGQYTLAPGSWATVSIASNTFVAHARAPLLYVQLAGSYAVAYLSPLAAYTFTHSSGAQILGYADGTGRAHILVGTTLLPEDEITATTAAQTLSMTIPALAARLNNHTATVTGHAPPNAILSVVLNDDYARIYSAQTVTATATGAFTATFPSFAELVQPYATITHINAQGYRTLLMVHPARWQVTLNSACVQGNAPLANTNITVQLQPVDGSVSSNTTYTRWHDSYFSVCFPTPIGVGSLLTLTTITNDVMTFTVPEVTARHDFGAQTLTGIAAPNARLTVGFHGGASYITRQTQAEANGHYGLDTRGLSLTPGQAGYVVVTDALGNTVRKNFTITGYLTYLPVVAK